jgi:hypothetical protein
MNIDKKLFLGSKSDQRSPLKNPVENPPQKAGLISQSIFLILPIIKEL